MRVALISGGSRGLGAALATALAGDGWAVVIDGRDAKAVDDAAARIVDNSPGARVVAIAGDITDADHRRALVDAAQRLGELTLVVNNASSLGPSPQPNLADYPLDVFAAVHRVNVVGPLGLIQLALPQLRRHRGTLINVTSDAAVEGYACWGGYGASKAALEQLTNVLAVEEPDVHTYWFDPGDMRTQMHQEAFPDEDISDRPLPETVVPAVRRLLDGSLPSGRYRASELLTAPAQAPEP